ncbi:MAG: hypothetical protein RBS17_07980 [Coriobacteriia bacterium]|nr:hypothetical protein [Coriobacteriia bacterium]
MDYLTRDDDEIMEIMAKPYGNVTREEQRRVALRKEEIVTSFYRVGASATVHNDEGILTIATMED